MTEPISSLDQAVKIIDGFTAVTKIVTAHLNNELSSEVAMAEIENIVRKVLL